MVRQTYGTRSGFTLIELLVVIAILAVLTGLLLSAVQRSRAAAARLQCQNQLRQLALAAHNYHDVQHAFPPGFVASTGKPWYSSSWLVPLLPFFERNDLYQTAIQSYHRSANPFNNALHPNLATAVSLLICPSEPRGSAPQHCVRESLDVAFTHYLGVLGTDLTRNDGVLFADSHIAFANITDGTSSTLLIGERPHSPDFVYGWWYAGRGQGNSGSADAILGVHELHRFPSRYPTCPPGRSPFRPGTIRDACDAYHFWSLHSGGANFAFCDGSIRFIAYGAAPIFPALATRAGGEVAAALD